MHFARLASSPRLQRVHRFLEDGLEHSTLEVALGAQVVNPGTYISELRAQGAVINCRQTTSQPRGERVWLYRMEKPVPGEACDSRQAGCDGPERRRLPPPHQVAREPGS